MPSEPAPSDAGPTRTLGRERWVALLGIAVVIVGAGIALSYSAVAGPDGGGGSAAITDPLEPAATVVPFPPARDVEPPSVDGHPDREFLVNDPDGQQIRAQFETGWTPVRPLDDGRIAFAPTEFLFGAQVGAVSEMVDEELRLVGYLIAPGIVVDRATFESPDFDWRVAVHAHAVASGDPASVAEANIELIEQAVGPGEVLRVEGILR